MKQIDIMMTFEQIEERLKEAPTNKENEYILELRKNRLNARPGVRVGDFLKIPRPDERCPEFTRFTHDHGLSIQTGGLSGSYYLTRDGHLTQSGGLHPGVVKADIVETPETKQGGVWFFDGDISGAGRGVNFQIDFRVFELRDGGDTSGIWELKCPYYVTLAPNSPGYRFLVYKNGASEVAFRTDSEFNNWLIYNKLAVDDDGKICWPSQMKGEF